MPTSIEAQGLTVDEAIQHALNSLGVGRDRVEITIVHHPRSGFLGIGARRAKVRATLRERVMEDGEEFDMAGGERRSRGRRRRRAPRRRGGGGDRQRNDGAEGQERQKQSEPQRSSDKPQARDERRGRERGQRSQDAGGQQSSRGRERRQSQPSQRGQDQRGQDQRGQDGEKQQQSSRRGGRGRRQSASSQRAAGSESSVPSPQAPAEAQVTPPSPPVRQVQTPLRTMTPDEVRNRAESVVVEMMKLMGIGAEVDTTNGPLDGEITVNVKAEAEGLLIGRRGQTLDAVEHVVNRMVVPHDVVSEVRVSIDVGGYRDRRRESLLALAERLKARAVGEGRRVQVSPMNARDRAIFEAALAGDDLVETRVLGSGVYRRLLIVPAGVDENGAVAEAAASEESVSSDSAPLAEPQAEALAERPGEPAEPLAPAGDIAAASPAVAEDEEDKPLSQSPLEPPSKDGD